MRISSILLLYLVIVVVNSTTTKTTRRRVVVTTGRDTTKAPTPKSAYAYLRTVRGKNSCSGGSCPFWERHGRSFAALRCYSQQYQECTCLHRMCFSSCMFTRQICNEEMASCLRQICPRCMPVSASAMCAVYDSMADRVAEALSVFACYPCCPNINSGSTNNSSEASPVITTTPAFSESSTTGPFGVTDDIFDPSATATPEEGEYYPGNENQAGTNNVPGTNQNNGNYPLNNVNNGVYSNGNNNVYSNGNVNGGTNGNSNVYSNGNVNGGTNSNTNGGTNGNNNVYSNGNVNGGTNGNTNVYSNGNSNAGTNGNTNSFSNGNSNGYSNGNNNGYSNSNTNGNGIPNTNGNGNSNLNGNGIPNTNGNGNTNLNSNGNGNPNGNVNSVTSGNGNSNGNGNSGNCNPTNHYPGIVFPGSDAMFYHNKFPHRNQQVIKQRGRQTVRTTKRRLTTTRRTPVTTRRMAQASVTVRGNNVKSGVRKPVQAQKKPPTNNHIKS